MALLIPDFTLQKTISMILKILRDDYTLHAANNQHHRSLLSLMFKNNNLGQYDLLENVVSMIMTTPESPNHIEAQLSYDNNSQSNAPIIWITLPSENNRNESLGVGEGNQEPLYLSGDDQDSKITQYNYRYATTYQIVIGSVNKNETTLLYHLIKSMLVVCIGHLEMEGFSNLKIGGGDIRTGAVPGKFYTKAITLNFEYEHVIPGETSLIYRKIRLYWKPEGATVAQGPIEVEVDDNINSDFDSES